MPWMQDQWKKGPPPATGIYTTRKNNSPYTKDRAWDGYRWNDLDGTRVPTRFQHSMQYRAHKQGEK